MGLNFKSEKAKDFQTQYDQVIAKWGEKHGGDYGTKAPQTIAKNILRILTKEQLSSCVLRDFFDGAGINKSSLYRILAGLNVARAEELYAIALVIGVPPEEFLKGGGFPNVCLLDDWNDDIMKAWCRVFCRNVADLTDCDMESDEPAEKIRMDCDKWQHLRDGIEPLSNKIINDTLLALDCKQNPEVVTMRGRTVQEGYPMAVLQSDGSIDMQALAFNLRSLIRMTMVSSSSITADTGRPASYILSLLEGEQPKGGIKELKEFANRLGIESRRLLGDDPQYSAVVSISPEAAARARQKQIISLNVLALIERERAQGKSNIRQRFAEAKISLGKVYLGAFDMPGCSVRDVAKALNTTEQDLNSHDILCEENTERMRCEILRAIAHEKDPRKQAAMKMLIEEQVAG